jgi:hypothetical protein
MWARGHGRRFLVAFMMIGLLDPRAYVHGESPAADPRPAVMSVPDVRLDRQHRFHGVVVNGQGHPMAQTPVKLTSAAGRANDRQPAESSSVVTDERGRFVFAEVAAGSYRIETTSGISLCRLWTHSAAPPSAATGLLVVNDPQVARGQRPIGELFRTDALLMATVVAAAIAIPIIVHKSQDDAPEGS